MTPRLRPLVAWLTGRFGPEALAALLTVIVVGLVCVAVVAVLLASR